MRALALIAAAAALAQSPEEIVRRSVERDQRNWELLREYTFLQEAVETGRDRAGGVNKRESETREISILYGEPYDRLVRRNGKPLSENEEKKERDKLEKFTARRARETPAQREKRLADLRSEREKQRAFLKEVPEAFTFRLAGEETVDSRAVWVVEALPRPGYRPKERRAGVLSKMRGKLWIDKSGFEWVRAEADFIENARFGLVLFRLDKGSRVEFEQTRVNNEIWLPRRVRVRAEGRIGMLKKMRFEVDVEYSDYRKFQTESRIVAADR